MSHPYAHDTGAAPEALAAALAAYDHATGTRLAVVAALQASRVLIPLVAVPGDPSGAGSEPPTMAAVTLTAPNGRQALLCFTSTEAMAAWDAQARPLPVSAAEAARGAIDDGAEALLLDPAGPVRFVLDGVDLEGLAGGWLLGRVGGQPAWLSRPAGPNSEPGE